MIVELRYKTQKGIFPNHIYDVFRIYKLLGKTSDLSLPYRYDTSNDSIADIRMTMRFIMILGKLTFAQIKES